METAAIKETKGMATGTATATVMAEATTIACAAGNQPRRVKPLVP